jgi:ferrous iron transport protein A
MSDDITTLNGLEDGSNAVVHSVIGEDAIARRIADLGFWKGTSVTLVRRAPAGDPLEVKLRGFRLALRSEEALRVRVVPLSEEAG